MSKDKLRQSVCECGKAHDYKITPFMTTCKVACSGCGKVNYVDEGPEDWRKIGEGRK